MKIYIENLDGTINDDRLREIFASYGEVKSAHIVKDLFTDVSRGFGYVEMEDEAAKKAIAELDNTTVDGRSIKVVEARPREDRPSGNRDYNNERSFNKNRF